MLESLKVPMPRWFIRLQGHEFDLQELSRLFCSGVRGVIQEEGTYYLVSSEFDATNDAEEVLRRGTNLLRDMNVAAQLGDSGYQPVECDNVSYLDEQGKRHHFVFLSGSIHLRSSVTASLSVEGNEGLKPERRTPDAELWVALSESDEKVRKVFEILALNEMDWDHLYKLFEVVEADVGGGIASQGWATKTEIKLFTQTATVNRHPFPKTTFPPNPMTLEDARAFIRRILVRWLRWKTRPE